GPLWLGSARRSGPLHHPGLLHERAREHGRSVAQRAAGRVNAAQQALPLQGSGPLHQVVRGTGRERARALPPEPAAGLSVHVLSAFMAGARCPSAPVLVAVPARLVPPVLVLAAQPDRAALHGVGGTHAEYGQDGRRDVEVPDLLQLALADVRTG